MQCPNHPLVTSGLAPCHRCGATFCGDCLVDLQGKAHCAPCKAEAAARIATGGEQGPGVGGGELPPWERRAELGMWPAFWQTISRVNGNPSAFFRGMDTSATTWDCLAIPCVLTILSTITMSLVMVLFLGAIIAAVFKDAGLDPDQMGVMAASQGFGLCGQIVFAPISAIISVFITAGLMHVFLAMTGKATVPFHQTMRGYCYAQAPVVVTVIPVLGHLVAAFWAIWTSVVMVKEVHRTSWGTAWMSVLWYMALFCIVCGGLYGVLIAVMISAQQGG